MKKAFIIFIVLALALVFAKILYMKYCQSQPQGCQKEKYDENQGLPKEGIDW
jgi:hypothetical protein